MMPARSGAAASRAPGTKPEFNFSFVPPVGLKTNFNYFACVHKRETYSRTKLMDIRVFIMGVSELYVNMEYDYVMVWSFSGIIHLPAID